MTGLDPEEFSPELAAWLARADGRITVDPRRWPGAFVVLDGGETAYVLDRADDGWITVSASSRGGDPEFSFRTPSLDVVERFLANEAGPAARFLAGLPGAVRVPFQVSELPADATLHVVREGRLGGREQLLVAGATIGEYGFGPSGPIAHADAVRAAHYGTATLAAIGESYLSADGSPLFSLR